MIFRRKINPHQIFIDAEHLEEVLNTSRPSVEYRTPIINPVPLKKDFLGRSGGEKLLTPDKVDVTYCPWGLGDHYNIIVVGNKRSALKKVRTVAVKTVPQRLHDSASSIKNPNFKDRWEKLYRNSKYKWDKNPLIWLVVLEIL